MFDNRFLAGVVAGLPISVLCVGYVMVRRDEVVRLFADGAGSPALSPEVATALMLAIGLVIGPVLGLASAVVYGLLPSETTYVATAFILATVLSLAAVLSRTPMMVEKVVLNYAVAMAFAIIAPRLVTS